MGIRMGLLVFGAVVSLGTAGYGIFSLNKKQSTATGEYNANQARYNREKRITDMFKKDDK